MFDFIYSRSDSSLFQKLLSLRCKTFYLKITFLILLIIVFSSSLASYTYYDFAYLALDSSSINLASGGNTVGVANVWHNSPLQFYSNPAIAAFHQNISFGFTSRKINNQYFNTSLISTGIPGQKGLSILLPALNYSGKFGYTYDSGKLQVYQDFEPTGETFEIVQNAIIVGAAINPIEMFCNSDDSLLKIIDLAFGINWLYLTNHSIQLSNYDKENIINLGSIAKITHLYKNHLKFEAVYGISYFNVSSKFYHQAPVIIDDFIEFPSNKVMVWRHLNQGYSGSISYVPLQTENSLINGIIGFENYLSLRFLNSYLDTRTSSYKNIAGYGFEIGFLDAIFFRRGKSEKDSTFGWGIKLNYSNVFSLEFNRSIIDVYQSNKDYTSNDFCVSFDLGK